MLPGSVIHQFSDAPRWLLGLIVAFVIGNLLGLFFFGPHTDEAYYWMLSQRPGLSYFDHPPLIPWAMRVFTSVLGNSVWAMRMPAAIAWCTGFWVVFELARQVGGSSRAAWTAALVFASLPIFQAGFHIVGPDSGLMLFSALAYYFTARAVDDDRPQFWLLAGLVTGLGLLAKYNMILVPAAIFIALLINRKARRQLLRPWPWSAGVLAVLCFLPVLIWNYQNQWASFAFQWQHGTDSNRESVLANLLFYLVNQAGVVLPWTWVAMLIASVTVQRYRKDGAVFSLTLLRTGFWFPLLFFGVTGLATRGHASWPAMAYIPGSILLGVALTHWLGESAGPEKHAGIRRVAAKFLVVVLALVSLLAANLLRFPQWATLTGVGPIPRGQSSNTLGWGSLTAEIIAVRTQQRRQAGNGRACRIVALPGFDNDGFPYYLAAAEIGLQLRDANAVTAAPGARLTQFDYWRQQEGDKAAPLCVAVTGPANHDDMPAIIDNGFGRWQRQKIVAIPMPDGQPRFYGVYTGKWN